MILLPDVHLFISGTEIVCFTCLQLECNHGFARFDFFICSSFCGPKNTMHVNINVEHLSFIILLNEMCIYVIFRNFLLHINSKLSDY